MQYLIGALQLIWWYQSNSKIYLLIGRLSISIEFGLHFIVLNHCWLTFGFFVVRADTIDNFSVLEYLLALPKSFVMRVSVVDDLYGCGKVVVKFFVWLLTCELCPNRCPFYTIFDLYSILGSNLSLSSYFYIILSFPWLYISHISIN